MRAPFERECVECIEEGTDPKKLSPRDMEEVQVVAPTDAHKPVLPVIFYVYICTVPDVYKYQPILHSDRCTLTACDAARGVTVMIFGVLYACFFCFQEIFSFALRMWSSACNVKVAL